MRFLSKLHHRGVAQMIWQQSWLELPVWETGTVLYVVYKNAF